MAAGLFFLFILFYSIISSVNSVIYHVNGNFPHSTDNSKLSGLSWSDPFISLYHALNLAKYGDEIWLAGPHTYTPPASNDRGNCFSAQYNVKIYGGFIGNELTKNDRSNNTNSLKSIISGNIGNEHIAEDNCYHVLTYSIELLLDRVTVTGGYADLSIYGNTMFSMDKYGGALITKGPSQKTKIILNEVEFINNVAINGGALWFMSSSQNDVNVMITNCKFVQNKALQGQYEGGYGGAIYVFLLANVSISNSEFIQNYAANRGGAMYQDYGAFIDCKKCTFDGNSAGGYGGALFGEDRNSQTDGTFPKIEESVFINNNASKCGGAICWYNGVVGELIEDEFIDNEAPTGAVTVVDAYANQTSVHYKHDRFVKESDHKNDSEKYSYWDKSYSDKINFTAYQDIIYEKSLHKKESNQSETICFVDALNNSPYQNGKSWLTAFQNLQSCIDYLHALGISKEKKEIWVKAGVYRPTKIPKYKIENGKQRTSDVSFLMQPNIALYGGFYGNETHRKQRNIRKNPTILSCYLPPPPTQSPTSRPTTLRPTKSPNTMRPTLPPKTERPTKSPLTARPTRSPVTPKPTLPPKTPKPTMPPTLPTPEPTKTSRPTTQRPSKSPITMRPTLPPKTPKPTLPPKTERPTASPTPPTPEPTKVTRSPVTTRPTRSPVTERPTFPPKTLRPTASPFVPTYKPSKSPITARPSKPNKTDKPTKSPSEPTEKPTRNPVTYKPTKSPKTVKPTLNPTPPTPEPTKTLRPTTLRPTKSPITLKPTKSPKTPKPTKAPFIPTYKPTKSPVTLKPTKSPKTPKPTKAPFTPTYKPTKSPITLKPTKSPKTPKPTSNPTPPTPEPTKVTRAPQTPRPTKSPNTKRPTKGAHRGTRRGKKSAANDEFEFRHRLLNENEGKGAKMKGGTGSYCFQIIIAADNVIMDGFIFSQKQNLIYDDSLYPNIPDPNVYETEIVHQEYNEHVLKRILHKEANCISTEKVLAGPNYASGGAIYSNATSIHISNSIFFDLFVPGKGGAMYCVGKTNDPWQESKSPTFDNVAFLANRAVHRGGAISADVDCNFECVDCIFDNNACPNKGGAIYMDFASTAKFERVSFLNGFAGESGGCLAQDGRSWTTFRGKNEFIGNRAKWEGGCLYSGSGATPSGNQGFTFPANAESNMIFQNVGPGPFDILAVDSNGNEQHVEYGQKDVYLWPFNLVQIASDESTQTPPTESYPPPTNRVTFDRPNFILILADDFIFPGIYKEYAPDVLSTSVFLKGTEYYDMKLPGLKRLMDEGLTIPRSYATSPGCAPSRFGILTGRYAVRSQWAIKRTLASCDGSNGVNVSVKLSKMTLDDEFYTIPQQLKHNGYSTGMVGKWHLANGDDEICDVLDDSMNATLYEYCITVPKRAGFEFVDAYYPNNIHSECHSFGHNPEWMVYNAQKFINRSINVDKKPFFLYFSHTLTHEPQVYDSLFRFNVRDTPKGVLQGDDIPSSTGMWSRSRLWEEVMNNMKNGQRLNTVAAAMWMDNSIVALIDYLQKMGIYDDTMIIFLTDHGMLGKFTLFEQGTRVMQIIRYPKLFHGGSSLPNDFITSTADLASIIFELSETQTNESYVMDSVNWLQDAVDIMSLNNESIIYEDDDDLIGTYRFADFYNSHALFTERYKYIWRPNALRNTESGANYPHSADWEQLYDLFVDGTEKNNIIDHPSLSHVVKRLRQIMTEYIQNVACPKMPCKLPATPHTANHSNAHHKQYKSDNNNKGRNKVDTRWSWMKYLMM